MSMTQPDGSGISRTQKTILVVLRILIGWHFLYEGLSKILMPNWTSAAYLQNSRWLFSDFFHWIAANSTALFVVDWLNMVGLTLVGLGLIFGLLSRTACLSGILLLALYYIANPPFIVTGIGMPVEGHYLFVDKNLIEMCALVLIFVFPTGSYLGLDHVLKLLKKIPKSVIPKAEKQGENLPETGIVRRELIKSMAAVPVLGALLYGASQKYNWEKINAITGATIKVSDTKLKDLKGILPVGEIAGKKISRMFLGGNLIGGWSHSRDLYYVSSLFKAYNTDKKIFETLQLAEKAGINTMNITGIQYPIINKYKRIFNSSIQTICQVHPTADDIYSKVDEAIDAGVDIIQIQGNCCDWRVKEGRIDVLAECIDYARKQGYPAGLGAHSVQALIACTEYGIKPDFFMKTLHHDHYWSAHPRANRIPFSVDGEKSPDHNQFHDNMFCLFPEQTVDFINKQDVPVIAFKVLAGGAIMPQDGFKFAFENGADFICVGMFDFQIVDDVNIALDVLGNLKNRTRQWCA